MLLSKIMTCFENLISSLTCLEFEMRKTVSIRASDHNKNTRRPLVAKGKVTSYIITGTFRSAVRRKCRRKGQKCIHQWNHTDHNQCFKLCPSLVWCISVDALQTQNTNHFLPQISFEKLCLVKKWPVFQVLRITHQSNGIQVTTTQGRFNMYSRSGFTCRFLYFLKMMSCFHL